MDEIKNLDEPKENTFKSQVLKRIYQKNLQLDKDNRQQQQQQQQQSNDQSSLNEQQDEEEINNKIKQNISNEWKIVLDRVLSNVPEAINRHHQLIKREETLQFFIKMSWTPKITQQQQQTKTKKGQRKKEKQMNRFNLLDNNQFKNLNDNLIVKRNVNFNKYFLKNIKSKQMIGLQDSFIDEEHSNDNSNDDYNQNAYKEDLFNHTNCCERFILQMKQSALNENNLLIKNNSIISKIVQKGLRQLTIMEDSFNLIAKNENNQQALNNSQFNLTFYLKSIEFFKHPSMSIEDQSIRQLVDLYREYCKLISKDICDKLSNLDTIINDLLEQIDKEPTSNDSKIKKKLLNEFTKERYSIVDKRRTTLNALLNMWNKMDNFKIKQRKSNRIELKLFKEEENDKANVADDEQKVYEELIEKRLKIEKYINIEEVDEEKVKKQTYLDDGRLPGELKYSKIDLKIKEKNKIFNKIRIAVEIFNRNKIPIIFEEQPLNSNYTLVWNQMKTLSISFDKQFSNDLINVNQLSYRPIKKVNDNDEQQDGNVSRHFPLIIINQFDDNDSKESKSKCLMKFMLDELPDFTVCNLNQMNYLDKIFQMKNKSNEEEISGMITFGLYWSNVSNNMDDVQIQYNNMIDSQRYKIERMTSLTEVEQKLYEIRYGTQLDFTKRLQLLDLLLRKKYTLEIEQLQFNDKKLINNPQSKKRKESTNETKMISDLFYHQDLLSSNKRFQLMFNRKMGMVNCKHYRFIPIEEKNIVINELNKSNEKQSFELLLEYIRQTCNQHERFISSIDNNNLKRNSFKNQNITKIKSQSGKNKAKDDNNKMIDENIDDDDDDYQQDIVEVYQTWCIDQRFPMQWLNIANQVLGQILSNHYHGDEIKMNHNIVQAITTYDDIIIESRVGSFPTSTFTLFPLLTSERKLNPSKKDRRKVNISIQEAMEKDNIQVVLILQNAFDVPTKLNLNEEGSKEFEDKNQGQTCSTMIEIRFDSNQSPLYSEIEEGVQPTWNENFKFNLKFNPKQNIYLNLFEVNEETIQEQFTKSDEKKMNEMNSEKEGDNYHLNKLSIKKEQINRRWLGQLRLPMNAFLFHSKVEGIFQLECPYFLNGYVNMPKFNQDSSNELETLHDKLNIKNEQVNDRIHNKLLKTVEQLEQMNTIKSLLGCLPSIALSIFVTTDPQIETNVPKGINYENSIESKELYDYCQKWKINLEKIFPTRRFVPIVLNLQRQAILSTRFLSPVKPPELVDLINVDQLVDKTKNDTKSMNRSKNILNKLFQHNSFYINLLIRYISLIPSFNDLNQTSNTEVHLMNINSQEYFLWMDCVQFFSLRLGIRMDHAICLCCFLLYLGKKACIAIGNSIHQGPMAFVILYHSNDSTIDSINDLKMDLQPILIDAQTGQKYNPYDYYLSLNTIDCIITETNVYGNIQKNNSTNQINFNLSKTHCWRPLFGDKEMMRFSINRSIQSSTIFYGNVNDTKVLETKIENYISEKFMNWRRLNSNTYTSFNRYCTQVVKRFLPQLEYHACLKGQKYFINQQLSVEERILNDLDDIRSVHRMIDYPLNVKRIDLDSIIRTIHSIGMHTLDENNIINGIDSKIEFIIACHVHSYPANVHSIWIYLAALFPKTLS